MSTDTTKPRKVQVHLQLPPALHQRLKEIAEQQAISMHQVIVLTLTSATEGFNVRPKKEEANDDPDAHRLA